MRGSREKIRKRIGFLCRQTQEPGPLGKGAAGRPPGTRESRVVRKPALEAIKTKRDREKQTVRGEWGNISDCTAHAERPKGGNGGETGDRQEIRRGSTDTPRGSNRTEVGTPRRAELRDSQPSEQDQETEILPSDSCELRGAKTQEPRTGDPPRKGPQGSHLG